MRNPQTSTGSLIGWGSLGTAIIVWLGSVLKRAKRVKAAREMNRRACDMFIRRHGLPDCHSILRATYGIAIQESRKKYCELKQQTLPEDFQRHREETYIVPDDVQHQDVATCLRWKVIQTELEEKWWAPCTASLSSSRNRAWQPPPTYTFAGCPTKDNKKLWRQCLNIIKVDIDTVTDHHCRDNMKACLAWVRSHGYPSTDYCLVWAACGIATCTTQGELSRFWAAHGQLSDRMSVYAVGISPGNETVINWRYGLATANLGVPPPRVGYEETWPEHFAMNEWLDEISWGDVKVRANLSGPLALEPLTPHWCKQHHSFEF